VYQRLNVQIAEMRCGVDQDPTPGLPAERMAAMSIFHVAAKR